MGLLFTKKGNFVLSLVHSIDDGDCPNSRACKGETENGEYRRILGEQEGNTDYGGMVDPSQQHVAPCVEGVGGGGGLRMGALRTK